MSGDNEDDIAVSVYEEINEEGFDVPMVDLLLDEATDGQIDLMGDVLIHLVKKDHADWAAELCSMHCKGAPWAEVTRVRLTCHISKWRLTAVQHSCAQTLFACCTKFKAHPGSQSPQHISVVPE
eukprot:1161394-Pelagomonas_calceolata.AAC.3